MAKKSAAKKPTAKPRRAAKKAKAAPKRAAAATRADKPEFTNRTGDLDLGD